MQYSTATLRLMAIEDILSGPEHLHRDLPDKMGELRKARADFPDSRSEQRCRGLPAGASAEAAATRQGAHVTDQQGGLLIKAALGSVRQVRPVGELAHKHPQAVVPSQDAEWWRLSNVDGALVSAADGTNTAWYQRDPALFRTLFERSLKLHTRLVREWPRLRETYRSAVGEFTSPDEWRKTFESSESTER